MVNSNNSNFEAEEISSLKAIIVSLQNVLKWTPKENKLTEILSKAGLADLDSISKDLDNL